MRYKFPLIIFLIFIIKIFFASLMPLVADESYYYVWSLFPQLSYFDHPGMVSWLIYIGDFFIPFHNPLSVRLFFVLLSTCTLILWLFIIKINAFSELQKYFFIGLFLLNPLLGLGSIFATPDVPLVFFWTFSYLCYLKLFTSNSLKWYFLLGASLGLGFCAKYHIVLFLLAGLLDLFFGKKFQRLRPAGIFATIGVGFIFSLPVLIWNFQNDWVSFSFQLKHGLGRSYYDYAWTWGYILGQILIASPFVLLLLFSKISDRKNSTDQVFSLGQLGFFAVTTFKALVEANWPIAAHPHALVHFLKLNKYHFILWTFIYLGFVYILVIALLFIPAGKNLIKNQLLSSDIVDISNFIAAYEPVYGPTYQVSSLLSWQSQKVIPKLRGLSRHDFFDDLPLSLPSAKKFYVLKETSWGWPHYLENAQYKKIETFDSLNLEFYQVTRE